MRRLTQTSFIGLFFLLGASANAEWNNPYPASETYKNILYSAFRERPKKLDPARSYSSNEYVFIAQIYEPPFQYHYLKRPYELVPLTATRIPEPVYLDRHGKHLPKGTTPGKIAYSVYTINIKPGIRYQPHPAFAKNESGQYLYHRLSQRKVAGMQRLSEFPESGSRELVAQDYVYQIKRLANPKLHSPIYSVMAQYIVGLKELRKAMSDAVKKDESKQLYLDLRKLPLKGVKAINRYSYQITIRGKYPQFIYWMAMPFFAPMPWEAERFFLQPGMAEKNFNLDWHTVGTGPYMLTVNDPNRKMILERNPNYHEELYPSVGEPSDRKNNLLVDAGKPMPFIDKVIFSLEKETIPYWNKFLQGYYDNSAISTESFDQAIKINLGGDSEVTADMQEKGISLLTSVATSTYYFGFNMIDPVVGGLSERARKLRRAISIAINYEEEISIFRNGRGIAAQGPLPPGIFGHVTGKAGINPYVYKWTSHGPQRRGVDEARELMKQAGYNNGIDPKTRKSLLLYLDTTGTSPEDKARLDWMRKQFKKIGIDLVPRATDYNRFQDKMSNGSAQMFYWGWNADYPDPENFLFLLYGPNAKVGKHGENAANYQNPEFDRLFVRMKNMENSPTRQRIINRMINIVRRDAPWGWGLHPKEFSLQHAWLYNRKPNLMANNTLKYIRIDPKLRAVKRHEWNKPVLWPIYISIVLLIAVVVPAVNAYRKRERSSAL